MKAVIMAGGKGTRLRPLTLHTPKPMVPLLNRPCMEYALDLLRSCDIYEIGVTVQYLPEVIRNYFGDGSDFGVKLHYFEEESPLGTAGSVKHAASFLDETFLVISGDALTDFNLRDAIEFHRQKQAIATMVMARVASPLEYGVVMTDDDGRVTRFLEKPGWSEVFSDTVNTGIYIMEPELLERVPDGVSYDFSLQLFPQLLEEGLPLFGYAAEGYWSDIGTLQQYRQTQYDMLDRKVAVRIQAAEPMPGLFVEEGVRLPSRIRLIGPSYIGAGCTLHPSCSIGPYTILGAGNVIFPHSALERSIVWNGCSIGSRAELQEALLMERTQVGQDVRIQEGAVIGSGCALGDKSVIRPEVKLWPGKRVDRLRTVNASLIWSEDAPASLFRGSRICGTPNADLTPAFAGELAAAYGSVLPAGASVVLAHGPHDFDALLQTAFAAGLRSAGVHVTDIGEVSAACARYTVRKLGAAGAVHIGLCPPAAGAGPERGALCWMDAEGRPLSSAAARKIEQAYFQEDYARGAVDRLGRFESYAHARSEYIAALQRELDLEPIAAANYAFVLHAPAAHAPEIEAWAAMLGGTRIHLRAETSSPAALLEQVRRLRADFGIAWDADDRLQVITPDGGLHEPEALLPLMVRALALRGVRASLGMPVSAPAAVEAAAEGSLLQIVRTKEDLHAQMEATSGLPLHPGAHPLYAAGLLIQCAAAEGRTLCQLQERLPSLCMAKEELLCRREETGPLLRGMTEWVRKGKHRAELLDGIRLQAEDGWVLILPDADEPRFQIVAQADSMDNARRLARQYANRLAKTQLLIRK
ncbi:sugar phosphate nucleotidyltransferase [Paenibacillus thiaminolyticus]|uniref:sugar phosphate nucleotidyltransferase n=1 Tax=Paenibacillus thiaminolyticus TaxID=49283 RepID=UPI0025435160|nr:sugar phosphate nucleotidyltransferase [Paenibacillus thiaminolyticus]WII36417.1 sugar phosphate nucleotidyltransferase [Paenibacillus thiaminolyticus]